MEIKTYEKATEIRERINIIKSILGKYKSNKTKIDKLNNNIENEGNWKQVLFSSFKIELNVTDFEIINDLRIKEFEKQLADLENEFKDL